MIVAYSMTSRDGSGYETRVGVCPSAAGSYVGFT